MKKTLLKYFTVALITISTISMPLTVKAAQKSNISIRPNVAYSKYDITGDGKADKIRINFKYSIILLSKLTKSIQIKREEAVSNIKVFQPR